MENAINPESAARMATQNRFKTGLDIAIRYTAAIMKRYGSVRCRFISIYTIVLGMVLLRNKI
jgi:isocitrate lyase